MSLYLKYRPKDFQSLVGQEFIKKTLQTALREEKIVSSYLLCGPRWTWKTTTARILAKGMNCENLQDGNPCDSCDICKAFLNNSLIDIIEIDAASHTGVDNIREIIERAQFQPTTSKYKVYIIDEVHMLSKWAFNALLKILEEPPKHVKFILATTETHKVPETIISRCQRYDFKSITHENIELRLQYIADKEGISVDKEALDYIANAASGWLRNAISLFEQLEEDQKVEYQNIIEKLGLTDQNIIHTLYEKLLQTDISVLTDIAKITWEGKNIQLFYAQLLDYAKKEAIKNIATENINTRIHILSVLNNWLTRMKQSFDPEVTAMTMLSQILWIYKEYVPETIQKEVSVSTSAQTNKPISMNGLHENTSQSETVSQPETTVSHTDIDDIFWAPEFLEVWEETQSVIKTSKEQNVSGFDRDAYIEVLRGLKTKWALIISLKQARSFTLLDECLEIVLQNNFTLKAMNTWDNVLQLIKGLEKMWIEGKTVKLC